MRMAPGTRCGRVGRQIGSRGSNAVITAVTGSLRLFLFRTSIFVWFTLGPCAVFAEGGTRMVWVVKTVSVRSGAVSCRPSGCACPLSRTTGAAGEAGGSIAAEELAWFGASGEAISEWDGNPVGVELEVSEIPGDGVCVTDMVTGAGVCDNPVR